MHISKQGHVQFVGLSTFRKAYLYILYVCCAHTMQTQTISYFRTLHSLILISDYFKCWYRSIAIFKRVYISIQACIGILLFGVRQSSLCVPNVHIRNGFPCLREINCGRSALLSYITCTVLSMLAIQLYDVQWQRIYCIKHARSTSIRAAYYICWYSQSY